MDLAEPADDLAAEQDLGRAAGLQARQLGGADLQARDAQLARERLDDALAVEEVERDRGLVPRRGVPSAGEDAADDGRSLGCLRPSAVRNVEPIS